MFRPLYWFCRCIPGFAMIFWILVCFKAFHKRIPSVFGGAQDSEYEKYDWHYLNGWEWIYVVYSVGAHLCACVFFQCRLAWSAWNMSEEIRLAKYEAAEVTRPYTESEAASSVDDKASLISLSSNHSSLPSDTPLSRDSAPKAETFDELSESVIHAIIVPSYKEDYDTLRQTLAVLASHILAKSTYDVYLALEERDPEGRGTANALIEAFKGSFHNISFTVHPTDIEGELPGKGSNVSWAARQLSHNYTEPEDRSNCVITVMDADTHLSSNYFCLLTKFHREDPDRRNSMYCVPIVFDRNSQVVNPFVRAADIFWCGAGLSGLYRGSSVMVPTSVYSVTMLLAGEIGGWDTGPESLGEDMHMFLKCYFKTRGQVKTRVIFSPASHCNVSSSTPGMRGSLDNMFARYKQALRHMWGSLDSGYAVRSGIESLFSKNDESLSGWLSSSAPEDRVPRWVKDSNLKHFTPPNVYEDSFQPQRRRFPWRRSALLYHRMYEAHFLPTHLTIALASGIIYGAFVPASVTNPVLLWSLSFCATLRLVGLTATGVFIYLYERYHSIAVRMREEEMKRAGLYEEMSDSFAYRSWKTNWTDYIALPINGTLYGSIPAVVAQICHLYTDRITYRVSAKPQLKRMAERIASLA